MVYILIISFFIIPSRDENDVPKELGTREVTYSYLPI